MLEEAIIKKVPGFLCPNPKEKQGYIENLNSKTKVELLELLQRQDKLLSNKSFVNKLLDKGERIKTFRERILKTLTEKEQIEQTCGLLNNLSLSERNVTEELEWTGKLSGTLSDISSGNSSAEEIDPLKILASQVGTGRYVKKIHRRLKEQESLEKRVDGNNASEVDSNREKLDVSITPPVKEDPICSSEIDFSADLYAKNWCDKVDKSQEKKSVPFKPHCTTKSGVHPGLFIPKCQGRYWEVTAATPPPPVHGAAKLMPLQESLQLQQKQAASLKNVQARHASEKLASRSHVKLGPALPDSAPSRSEYRETHQEYDSSNSSDAEENDDQSDEDDKKDTIVYTYIE